MTRSALAVIFLSLTAMAEVPLLQMVPSEATVIGGIHVDRTVGSAFGQFVLSQMNTSDRDFQEMIEATGFDPRRDLREVVVAGVSANMERGPGLVLARGVFNGPQIFAAVRAKSGRQGTETTYRGVPILIHGGPKHSAALAIVDGSLALAGNADLVRAALDRRAGVGSAPALGGKAGTLDAQYDAWMVTNGVFRGPLAAAAPGNTGRSNGMALNLEGITETSGGVTFSDPVRFNGEAIARSDKDAQALADVLRFVSSLAQLNSGNTSEIATIQALLGSLDIRTAGNVTKLSFALPVVDLERLLKSSESHHGRRMQPVSAK